MAVSVAAELSSINYRETAITLTPAGKGIFEVYVDGKKTVTLKGNRIAEDFQAIVENYVREKYGLTCRR